MLMYNSFKLEKEEIMNRSDIKTQLEIIKESALSKSKIHLGNTHASYFLVTGAFSESSTIEVQYDKTSERYSYRIDTEEITLADLITELMEDNCLLISDSVL